ncbi:MAG: autotransporter domain-containing protein [Pseudomonadota bacterium]|nr:autotransporter domain-containing protein [Pseudomonadota bacterium]
MNRPVRTVLAAALALAAAPTFAQTYSQTIFFGDSLTDSGHFRPALVQVAGPQAAILGRFTTNPGLVWAEYLADYYSAAAVSANQGGTNFAVGGARTGTNTASALGPIPSIATQVNSYLASNGGRADANALYTVWGGANDLFAVAAGAPAQATIGAAVTSQIGVIGTLQAAGARYVLVPTIPDLGLTPLFRAQGPLAQAQGTQITTAYNGALFGGLSTAGLRVIPLDTFNLFREIAANPSQFGFTNITGTACQPQITASSLTCSPANFVSPDAADTYAFADGVHPTSRSHLILSQFAVSVLEAPRQVALLPQVEALVGRNRADRVSANLRHRPAGDGMRAWSDLAIDYQNFDEDAGVTVDAEGRGPTLSAGLDWGRGNVSYGGFIGFGRQSVDYGQNRGEFSLDDTSVGGYVGWRGDNAWVSGQASYSWLGFEVDREVALGPVTRVHRGEADGTNLTVAFDAGINLGSGALRHGPVLAVVSQRIDVDGFAEDQAALSTSLAYPEQNVDSLVGSIGWQATFNMSEHLAPYARLTWDREFEDDRIEAFAQSQTVAGTAPYAVPGLELDNDYGTVMVGARSQVFGLDANLGLTGSVAREGAANVGAFLNLSRGF